MTAPLSPARAASVVRGASIADRVVLVDGVAGCGKTLISAIVSSLDRMELQKYDYPLEYACQLHYMGKLDPQTAAALARNYTDKDLYDLMMSRETNFRLSDLSGVFSNPRPWRYVKRLFQAGDGAVLERVPRERPILNLVTHNLLAIGQPLFDGLGDRLRLVEVIRHPLYMLKQLRMFMPRCAKDPRHFSLWIDHHGQALPWFAYGWEDRFAAANMMDRTIFALERLLGLGRALHESLAPEQRARVLVIPFEPFVLDPEPFMARLHAFTGAGTTAHTSRELRRQNVPRRMIADGIDLKVYRENGWQPPKEGDERAELRLRREFAAKEASAEGLAALDTLCRDYESRYWPVGAA